MILLQKPPKAEEINQILFAPIEKYGIIFLVMGALIIIAVLFLKKRK